MSILQLLFVLVHTVTTIAGNDQFEVTLERAELAYINSEYWQVEYRVSKINRTTVGLSVNGTIFKTMSTGLLIDGTVYVFLSNQYKRTAVAYNNFDLCRMMTMSKRHIEQFVSPYGVMPKSCPIQAGSYYVKNLVLSSETMENIPWDKVMVEGNISYGPVSLMSVRFYVKFDRDIIYRRPFM